MTKAMVSRGVLGVLVGLALAWQVRAEEAKVPQTYVVLVGISHYPDPQIKPRPHAEADAQALYDLFTNKDYLGAPARNVRLLLGAADAKRSAQPATRENILTALHWVASEARANDRVLFAFFGEGGPLGESGERRGYFAVDSTFKDRNKDSLAAAEVGEALKPLKSKNFCAFVDVDFKGFTTDTPTTEATLGSAPYKEFLGDDGTEDHNPNPGRVVFLATNGLSPSLDLKDHGIFARALLDGLKGEADKEGYEPDGVVTVDELTEYLDKKMGDLAREFGKTQKEKEQAHFVLGGRGTHFVLAHNPAVAAKVRERLAKLDELARDKKLSAKDYEEGKQLLAQMPHLEAQRSIRKEYQALVDGKITVAELATRREAILETTKLRRTDALEFAHKVMEAVQTIREGYVKNVSPGDMVSWAIKGLYRRVEEKIPAEIEAGLNKAKDMKDAELTDLLAQARQALGKREDLDKHKDLDITLQRMLSHLDPYTTYIDPETLERFRQDVQGNFTGIGIHIKRDPVTDMLMVTTPIKGSPAYKAGLMTGDVLTTITREVDNEGNPLPRPEVTTTKGMQLSDAVKKILGKADTKVKVTVRREGVSDPIEFEISRGRVELETVLGVQRRSNDEWNFIIDKENKIGYVRLASFSRNTYRDLKRVMEDLTRRGIKGFVLDLRFNPGGLLDSAVKISDLFLDDGLIVSIRPREGKEQRYNGVHEGSLLDFPMVCMVNGGSASGSEIVSAALQDHKRALIIGERSYGKGSVQNIQPFAGGELKLTTASFWRPSGKNLNRSSTGGRDDETWGVIPDRVVKLSRKDRDDLAEYQRETEVIPRKDIAQPSRPEFRDRQLDEALNYLRDQIKTAARAQVKKAG